MCSLLSSLPILALSRTGFLAVPALNSQVNAGPPEPDNPGFFAIGDAVPLATEHVIIALLVAYRYPLEDEVDGWCKDVLLQEKRWSEVRFAPILLVAAFTAHHAIAMTCTCSACTGGR
jgi:hypothetical protein